MQNVILSSNLISPIDLGTVTVSGVWRNAPRRPRVVQLRKGREREVSFQWQPPEGPHLEGMGQGPTCPNRHRVLLWLRRRSRVLRWHGVALPGTSIWVSTALWLSQYIISTANYFNFLSISGWSYIQQADSNRSLETISKWHGKISFLYIFDWVKENAPWRPEALNSLSNEHLIHRYCNKTVVCLLIFLKAQITFRFNEIYFLFSFLQMFHICTENKQKFSFFCPEGTYFNQKHLVCDWGGGNTCMLSPYYYTSYSDQWYKVHQHEKRRRRRRRRWTCCRPSSISFFSKTRLYFGRHYTVELLRSVIVIQNIDELGKRTVTQKVCRWSLIVYLLVISVWTSHVKMLDD